MAPHERRGPPCSLGVRPKTGSAALVALAGAAQPVVRLRETAVFAAGDHAPERFVYHRAAELDLAAAEAFIERLRAEYVQAAADRLEKVAQALAAQGCALRRVALACGEPAPLPPLSEIVRSHARIHAAEGAFWAEIWSSAAGRLGLNALHTPETQAIAVLTGRFGVEQAEIGAAIAAMGCTLGPPWTAEQRAAAAAAWAASTGLPDRARIAGPNDAPNATTGGPRSA